MSVGSGGQILRDTRDDYTTSRLNKSKLMERYSILEVVKIMMKNKEDGEVGPEVKLIWKTSPEDAQNWKLLKEVR